MTEKVCSAILHEMQMNVALKDGWKLNSPGLVIHAKYEQLG